MSVTKVQLVSNIVGNVSGGASFTGIVTASSFSGDGSGLTGTGSALEAASGSQRLVVTSLTSGTMTSAATDADLTWNSTTNTLSSPTFSGNITGTAVTATTFVGALTGNADTATTATNAQGITGTPDITVRNVTGVGATFSGDVNISGTLSYEDVTNIDSVGIITARSGIVVSAGGINAVGVVTANAFVDDGTDLLTEINTKASTGKAIAMAMVFG